MEALDIRFCRVERDDDDIYRLLVDNANEGIYIAQDGFIRYANPKSSEIIGYSRGELSDMPVVDIIYPDDREWVMRRHSRRLESHTTKHVYSHRIIQKSGCVRWVEVNTVRVLWKEGPALLIFATDITDRKEAEDALRESELRYRTLFYSIPSPVFYYDLELCIIEANERFAAVFGLSGQSMVGMDLTLLKDERLLPCLRMPMEGTEGIYEGGFRGDTACKELWIFANTLPVYRSTGELAGGIGIFQNLTERKRTEQKLKEREQEIRLKSQHLEEANTALRVILRHNEEQLLELQSSIMKNIDDMIHPLLRKLKARQASDRERGYVDLVQMNLREIASPFLRNMTVHHYNLTAQERQIAALIRDGHKTDEIASMLALSRRSVEHHRYKIRDKLGLRHKKANLRTKLLSLAGEETEGADLVDFRT